MNEADPSSVRAGRWGNALEGNAESLRELANSYWYCVYAWWRRHGLEPDAAAAATRGSFGQWLESAMPQLEDTGSTRLREWISARLAEISQTGMPEDWPDAVEVNDAWAEERFAEEPEGEPDAIFQRRWALTIVEFATSATRDEYAARGEDALFEECVRFSGFENSGEEAYAEAGSRTGRSTAAMRKAVFDFRKSQHAMLRAFVADTVSEPGEIEGEMTALLLACDAAGAAAFSAPLPSVLAAVQPDQMLARMLNSVKMSTGGGHGWTPPSVAEVAQLFPNFEVLSMLGHGGMGAVYQARQTSLDRLVAIKLLPLEISVDQDFADRFRREARAMAKLNHPNIISVYDFGTTSEGHLYFVMEFVDGAMLHDLIHTREPIGAAQALELVEQVCDALAYAHGKGIVHRDIKPANVMVEREGRVKVADFGLARLTDPDAAQWGTTMTGVVMGTPDYMAPEQKRGMHVDHRADIYALGVLLYEALCRETPQGAFELPSKRCGLDKRLDVVITKALAQQPDSRFQSTSDLKAAIALIRPAVTKAEARRAPTKIVPSQDRVAAPRKQNRAALAGIGVAGVAFALIIGFGAKFFLDKATPPISTQSSTTPEKVAWENLLERPGFLPATAVREGEGYRFQDTTYLQAARGVANAAVRMRVSPGANNETVEIQARGANSEHFQVYVSIGNDAGLMFRARGETPELPRFITDAKKLSGKPLDMEIRAEKSTITGRINDQSFGPLSDTAERRGNWILKINKGALLYSVEFASREPLPSPGKSTPTDVLAFGGHRYQMVPNAVTWDDAKAVAEARGGHLAVIVSKVERDWFDQTYGSTVTNDGGAFWLGASRAPGDSPWKWVTGEAMSSEVAAQLSVPPGTAETYVLEYLRKAGQMRWEAIPKSAKKMFYFIEWDNDRGPIPPPPPPPTGRPSTTDSLPPNTHSFWNSLEGVKPDGQQVRFEDGVLRLDGGRKWIGMKSADCIVRARIRQNPDAVQTQIRLRSQGNAAGYSLLVGNGEAKVTVLKDNDLRTLGKWLLPRKYGADDWPLCEFKAVGDELIATVDGEVIGKIRDSTISAAGEIQVYAKTNGFFREISVTELNTDSAKSPPGSASKNAPAPFTNSLGMKFVPVPGTDVMFCIHETRKVDFAAFAEGNPTVPLEWKNPQRDGVPVSFAGDHPVCRVNWDEATAFCTWLSKKEGRVYRLPTDREWSMAVGIGEREDPSKWPEELKGGIPNEYPWGTQFPPPPGSGNFADSALREKFPARKSIVGYTDGFATTAPVMSFSPNKFGLYDMSGNVWEWCQNWYNGKQAERVIRGGNWDDTGALQSAYRGFVVPTSHHESYGFRVVLEQGQGSDQRSVSALLCHPERSEGSPESRPAYPARSFVALRMTFD